MEKKSMLFPFVVPFLDAAREETGKSFYLFGDSAFSMHAYMRHMYREAHTDPVKEAVNKVMARSRISVEWGFGDVYNVWRRLRDPDKQTLLAGVPAIQMQLGFF